MEAMEERNIVLEWKTKGCEGGQKDDHETIEQE